MKIFKKILLGALLALLVLSIAPTTFAADTILPSDSSGATAEQCKEYVKLWEQEMEKAEVETVPDSISLGGRTLDIETMLACGIKSGELRFWMVKYFVVYALEFLLSIAALLSILMIMVGAYYYIAGGLTDDKEKGKTIIQYAIGGLVLATVAWVIVNVILLALTS